MARHAHAVFEFGREAPGFPPERFDFQEIAERLIRGLPLHLASFGDGAVESPGIDVVENGGNVFRTARG